MDGEAFDRLSMVVHRLRDTATRRDAMRVLLGGSVVAATGLLGDDAEARKKKNKKSKKNACRRYTGRCNRNRDCCNGKCRNGWCYYNGGGGGGGGNTNCGGRRCPNGWRCQKQGGVSVCVPKGYPTYCGGNNAYVPGYQCCNGANGGACPSGWKCCGGFNQCCGPDQRCCGNGRCCPRGWYCGNVACYANQAAADGEVSVDGVRSADFIDPVTVDAKDWVSLDH
jgi:hypothetical protein